MNALFQNRVEAGRELAAKLLHYANRQDVVVLALPRGGVPVAYEIARKLHAPLAALIVRKLGVPSHCELAMGAIASGGIRVLNNAVIREYEISDEIIRNVAGVEEKKLRRQEQLYCGHNPPVVIQGRTIILVDDGIATGSTMQAAVQVIRHQQPERLVLAAPIAAPEACELFRRYVDEIVVWAAPSFFVSVGQAYGDFSPTSDEEVIQLLDSARAAFC